MADKRILLTLDSLEDFSNLDKAIRKSTIESFRNLFTDPSLKSVRWHDLRGEKDAYSFTINSKKNFRAKVKKIKNSNKFYVLALGSHSYAYDYHHALKENDQSQSLEIIKSNTINEESLASQYLIRDLQELGVSYEMAKEIINLNDLEEFEEKYQDKLTKLVFNRLDLFLDLTTRYSLEEIMDNYPDFEEEIKELEIKPVSTLDIWRISLSEHQRDLVEKNYKGPTLLKGVAGTGKSVVILYRARELAKNLDEGKRILVTTFNNHLPKDIRENLKMLCKDNPEILDKIDIYNIDDWNKKFLEYKEVERKVNYEQLHQIWEQVLKEKDPKGNFRRNFYEEEWNKIVVPNDIETEEEYLKTDRSGRKVRLSQSERKKVWQVLKRYSELLQEKNIHDNVTAKQESIKILENQENQLYEHILIDEGQDLDQMSYKLIRALAGDEHPNDIFIVLDPHQLIYKSDLNFNKAGINIRGRTLTLRRVYRTPKEIERFAFKNFCDMENSKPSDGIYLSEAPEGNKPDINCFDSFKEEFDYVYQKIKELEENDIVPGDICITARTSRILEKYAEKFDEMGIPYVSIKDSERDDKDKIRIGTLYRVKGLEFEYIFIVGVNDEIIPHQGYLNASPKEIREEIKQMEKNLLYVALTRARHGAFITTSSIPSEFIIDLI